MEQFRDSILGACREGQEKLMTSEERLKQQGRRIEDAIKKYPSDHTQIQQIEREKRIQQQRDERVREQNQRHESADRC
ncbi:MAG: hypothetical protein QOF62_3830 [Pyrinomonadaceae bacterium]|jgi:hypothetical protein|nr:hypothetical protein [Pyrinomonadaceae bacterium]